MGSHEPQGISPYRQLDELFRAVPRKRVGADGALFRHRRIAVRSSVHLPHLPDARYRAGIFTLPGSGAGSRQNHAGERLTSVCR